MSPTVLLVEDDRELRSTLVQALSVEGYTVATAASVADARAQAAHRRPDRPMDIVLLDLSLPDGDGETLLADHSEACSTARRRSRSIGTGQAS